MSAVIPADIASLTDRVKLGNATRVSMGIRMDELTYTSNSADVMGGLWSNVLMGCGGPGTGGTVGSNTLSTIRLRTRPSARLRLRFSFCAIDSVQLWGCWVMLLRKWIAHYWLWQTVWKPGPGFLSQSFSTLDLRLVQLLHLLAVVVHIQLVPCMQVRDGFWKVVAALVTLPYVTSDRHLSLCLPLGGGWFLSVSMRQRSSEYQHIVEVFPSAYGLNNIPISSNIHNQTCPVSCIAPSKLHWKWCTLYRDLQKERKQEYYQNEVQLYSQVGWTMSWPFGALLDDVVPLVVILGRWW